MYSSRSLLAIQRVFLRARTVERRSFSIVAANRRCAPSATPNRRYFSKETTEEEKEDNLLGIDMQFDGPEKRYNKNKKHQNPDFDYDMYTKPITIRMPDMDGVPGGNDSTIETWFKQPGDIVKRDDVICDIATPDFTFGMVTDDEHDAVMGEIFVEAGQVAQDNAPICTVLHPREENEKEAEAEAEKEDAKDETPVEEEKKG